MTVKSTKKEKKILFYTSKIIITSSTFKVSKKLKYKKKPYAVTQVFQF